jgi:hypothetical protein
MKRRILALVVALLIVALVLPAAVFGADEGVVVCTVSGVIVSLGLVSDGTVDYGSLALGASANTTPTGVNESQHVTNNGTVAEDFFIKSSDATRGGGTTWELVIDPPTHNEFMHEWSSTGGPPWTAMNASNDYGAYVGPVNPGITVQLDLQITMPSTTDDYLEHTITVTVMATEH